MAAVVSPQRWARAKEVFAAVMAQPTEGRQAFIEHACGDDQLLARAVLDLVASNEAAGSFLERRVKDVSHGDETAGQARVDLLSTGTVVSNYRIVGRLGQGGMGVVFEGEDLRLGRRVALKFLPENAALTASAMARFSREARAASALNHPNICVVYDIDEHMGRPFIVMEKLEGDSLDRWIKRETIPIPRLLEVAIDVAEALEAAHSKHIVHRDVKSANVFVTAGGRAKVLDFGLAKLLTDRADSGDQDGSVAPVPDPAGARDVGLTSTGMALGTAAYMSPEQARGELLDARSDLFSLGVVLFEMATARRPFEGAGSADLREAILRDTPLPPSRLRADLPRRLESTILKLLEKDRARRHGTAGELLQELRGLQRSQIRSAARPRITILIRAAVVVAAAAVVSFGAIALHGWQDHERATMRQEILDAARTDNVEEIARLLHTGFSAVEALDYQGNTACHVAAEYGQHRTLRLLLRLGCDPSTKNIHGDDAFMIAAARQPQNTELWRVLDQWRADHAPR